MIHSTIWPQYTNVTERQPGQTDRTDTHTSKQANVTSTLIYPKVILVKILPFASYFDNYF